MGGINLISELLALEKRRAANMKGFQYI